ncbi:NAD-dependent epimerase/dehydratase family protein [Streptomyces sp. NPDC021224]|uniref:NAD-dependent epimerase/dehydratase family protein n=1 Tax=unclassified Streptomyces TaxID=2593676 RepID=UPI0037B400A4
MSAVRRILVLGARGFLGGPVAARLAAEPGVTVLHGSRRAAPAEGPAPDLGVDLGSVPVDLLAAALGGLRPDAVVNCAGLAAGPASTLAAVNARGAAALAEAMSAAVPNARLVHLGSAGEYGPGLPGEPLAETAPARPAGVYGATKLAGTLAVTGSGLDAVALRVFNPVGAGAPVSGLPGRLAAAFRGAPPDGVVRTGDLGAYRDFVDVADVAEAVALAATAPGPLPPVLNIGSGVATPVRDLAAELAVRCGFTGRVDESGTGSERSAAVSWVQADVSLAATALGWRPTRTLHDSLAALSRAATPAPAGARP